MSIFLLAPCLALAIASTPLPAEDAAVDPESPAAVLDRSFRRLAVLGYSGGLSVVDDGVLLLEAGFGFADRSGGVPTSASTVFDCGSITKQFTAAAILRLEADGALSVSDSIEQFFEDVPADKRGITLHQLLTHTAGLPGAIGADEEAIDADAYSLRALATPLQSQPGERYDYSNVGFSLLGIVVERVSGQPYEQFLRERLFLPAGMKETGYVLPAFAKERVAKCYRGAEEWGRTTEQNWGADGPGWNLKGNGGIHLTLADAQRWVAALAGDTVLPEEQREKLFTPHVDEGGGDSFYGYGWVILDGSRGRMIQHNGGNLVFSANLCFMPNLERSVFVVSTQREFNADDLCELVLSILNGGDPPEIPDVEVLAPAALAALAGRYELEGADAIDVEARFGCLHLAPEGARATAALYAEDAAAAARDGRLAERTLELFEAALDGEYGLLSVALGRPMSAVETGQRFQALLGEGVASNGAFERVDLLGARPFRGQLAVWLRLRFANATVYTAYLWEADRIAGQVLSERAPDADYAPLGGGAFAPFSLRANAARGRRVEFGHGEDGVATLTVMQGAERVMFRRAE